MNIIKYNLSQSHCNMFFMYCIVNLYMDANLETRLLEHDFQDNILISSLVIIGNFWPHDSWALQFNPIS